MLNVPDKQKKISSFLSKNLGYRELPKYAACQVYDNYLLLAYLKL